jgi:predicted DNA-binding transcriptional regulator YafY
MEKEHNRLTPMAKRLAYERYLWLHHQMQQNRCPTLLQFQEKFEMSPRQASREIAFMRDFFHAPIEYDADSRGYRYSDAGFQLPDLWLSQTDLIALAIGNRLKNVLPQGPLRERLDDIIRHLAEPLPVAIDELQRRISTKSIRQAPVNPDSFQTLVSALSLQKRCRISYQTPYSQEISEREIAPLHLLLYQENWHLIAHCFQRSDLRTFVLSRIMTARITEDPIPEDLSRQDLGSFIDRHYGIFLHGEPSEVCIRFLPPLADLARQQIWHPQQRQDPEPSGALCLSFPVGDFRELLGDILRCGPHAEVISPASLRQMIKEHLENTLTYYQE